MILHGSVFSQHYNFKNISTKDGLSSNFVYRVHKDKRGYYWYLTDKGISNFDGVRWKYFSSEQGYNDVGAFHVVESADGVLWFITTNFKLYRFSNNKFQRIPVENVAWLDVDLQGNKWILTREHKIFLCNYKGVTPFRVKGEMNGVGYSVVRAANKDFIVATSAAVYRVKSSNHSVGIIQEAKTFENYVQPRIYRRRNGNVIISNFNGVYNYDLSRSKQSLIYRLEKKRIIFLL